MSVWTRSKLEENYGSIVLSRCTTSNLRQTVYYEFTLDRLRRDRRFGWNDFIARVQHTSRFPTRAPIRVHVRRSGLLCQSKDALNQSSKKALTRIE